MNNSQPDVIDLMTEFDLDPQDMLRNPTIQQLHSYANNDHIGNPIKEEKADGLWRVVGVNPNDFTLNDKGGDFAEFCLVLKLISADAACGFRN